MKFGFRRNAGIYGATFHKILFFISIFPLLSWSDTIHSFKNWTPACLSVCLEEYTLKNTQRKLSRPAETVAADTPFVIALCTNAPVERILGSSVCLHLPSLKVLFIPMGPN